MVLMREAVLADWPGVWGLLEPVFRAGKTYSVSREITEDQARCSSPSMLNKRDFESDWASAQTQHMGRRTRVSASAAGAQS